MCNSLKKMVSSILGLHLDRRLSCHKHIFVKRKQLRITLTKMYWLLGRKSKLSTSNKLLIPIWTYGIHLWGTASTSNIEILESFQSKTLRMIVDAPWYVSNTVIRRDLQLLTVKEEIRRYSSQYSSRLSTHLNDLIVNLIGNFPKRTSIRDMHQVFHIPYVCDYITKSCRQQAEVIQNHENAVVRYNGQGEARHRKYKRLKLGGGHVYDCSSA
jgi:hypothetical protein